MKTYGYSNTTYFLLPACDYMREIYKSVQMFLHAISTCKDRRTDLYHIVNWRVQLAVRVLRHTSEAMASHTLQKVTDRAQFFVLSVYILFLALLVDIASEVEFENVEKVH